MSAAANAELSGSDQFLSKITGIPQVEIDASKPLLILLGKTGSGKSSFTNFAVGAEAQFKISHGSYSETSDYQVCYCENLDCYIVDTPGFGDVPPEGVRPKMTDEEIIKDIARLIKQVRCQVLAFILFVNRMSRADSRAVSEFSTLLTKLIEIMGFTVMSRVYFSFKGADDDLLDFVAAKTWNLGQCDKLMEIMRRDVGADDPLRSLAVYKMSAPELRWLRTCARAQPHVHPCCLPMSTHTCFVPNMSGVPDPSHLVRPERAHHALPGAVGRALNDPRQCAPPSAVAERHVLDVQHLRRLQARALLVLRPLRGGWLARARRQVPPECLADLDAR
jgi:hypothetical protein